MITLPIVRAVTTARAKLQPLLRFAAAPSRPLITMAAAGAMQSLGLFRLLTERSRREQRAALAELVANRPAASALTFTTFYVLAMLVSLLVAGAMSLIIAVLIGGWVGNMAVTASAGLVLIRALMAFLPCMRD